MRFKELTRTPESYFALACLVLSALALAFIGALVAEPKVLFGRSLGGAVAVQLDVLDRSGGCNEVKWCSIQLVFGIHVSASLDEMTRDRGEPFVGRPVQGGAVESVFRVYVRARLDQSLHLCQVPHLGGLVQVGCFLPRTGSEEQGQAKNQDPFVHR